MVITKEITALFSFHIAALLVRFWRLHNQQPTQNTTGLSFSFPGKSHLDCYDKCLLNLSDLCSGFMFDKYQNVCTILRRVIYRFQYEVAEGKDLFLHNGQSLCAGCSNILQSIKQNQTDLQGMQLNNAYGVVSIDFCRRQCLYSLCYGFSYNNATKLCHVSINKDYRLSYQEKSVFYQTRIICFPTRKGCTDSPRFISTKNTSPPEMSHEIKMGDDSKFKSEICAGQCTQRVIGSFTKPCYGFSVNYNKSTCFLYYNFDHPLGVVGGSPGVDQYRRILYFNASCNETHIKYKNAGSSDGILQPKDINTFAICAARCVDYKIATDMTCYGFGLNRKTDECTIFTRNNYMLSFKVDVDNYRRNKTCELPY